MKSLFYIYKNYISHVLIQNESACIDFHWFIRDY
jgi:hypothetical protein